jgi:predicted small lipoprotein YifL
MGALIGLLALAALFAWLMGFGSRRPAPLPEDDVETPADLDELAQAEAELRRDPQARSIGEALEGEGDDDDWGPGSPGRGGLPGIS